MLTVQPVRRMLSRSGFRTAIRAVALLAGVLAAFFAGVLQQEGRYTEALLPTSLILIAGLIEFYIADIVTNRFYPVRTEEILKRIGAELHVIDSKIKEEIQLAIDSLQGCDQSQVSGAFHLTVDIFAADGKEEQSLLQVTDYVGDLGGVRWRFTHPSKGVIGRCLRTGNPEYVNFRTLAEYKVRMVEEFGFSVEEIEKHTKQARSYWAHPVFLGGKFVGVIYLFSTEVQVFPRAVDDAKLNSVAQSVAKYLDGVGVV